MKKILLIMTMLFVMVGSAMATPIVTLSTPNSGQTVNSKSITFYYYVSSTEDSTTCIFQSNVTGIIGTMTNNVNTTGSGNILDNFALTSPDNVDLTWKVSCTDVNATVISANQTLRVRGTPSITSSPIVSVIRNQQYIYNVASTDPNGETRTYSLTTAPEGMTINAVSGQITWTPTVISRQTVTVRAVDPSGLYAEQSFNVDVLTDSKLKIDYVNIELSGDENQISNFETVEDTDSIMGESIYIYVQVCNSQPIGEDIENVDIKVKIRDLDNGNNIEGTASRVDVDGGDCEEKKIKLDVNKIPFTADYKTYKTEVDIEGRNISNGVKIKDGWTVYFKVYKDSDPNIQITNLDVFPTEVSCQRDISLDVSGVNIGDNDDKVVLKIESSALKIFEIQNFEMGDNPSDDCNALDEKDNGCFRFDGTFSYSLSDNLLPGTYPISVYTYYQTSRQTSKKTFNLKVSKCTLNEKPVVLSVPSEPSTPTQPSNPQNNTVVIIQQPNLNADNQPSAQTPIRIVEKGSLSDNNLYVILLAIANVGILAILIGMIWGALRKKNSN